MNIDIKNPLSLKTSRFTPAKIHFTSEDGFVVAEGYWDGESNSRLALRWHTEGHGFPHLGDQPLWMEVPASMAINDAGYRLVFQPINQELFKVGDFIKDRFNSIGYIYQLNDIFFKVIFPEEIQSIPINSHLGTLHSKVPSPPSKDLINQTQFIIAKDELGIFYNPKNKSFFMLFEDDLDKGIKYKACNVPEISLFTTRIDTTNTGLNWYPVVFNSQLHNCIFLGTCKRPFVDQIDVDIPTLKKQIANIPIFTQMNNLDHLNRAMEVIDEIYLLNGVSMNTSSDYNYFLNELNAKIGFVRNLIGLPLIDLCKGCSVEKFIVNGDSFDKPYFFWDWSDRNVSNIK